MIKYIFSFFLTLLITSHSFANSYKLVVDSRNWYPFVYVDEFNKISGMHVDIVKKAFELNGVKFKIEAYPRKRAIIMVERGNADGIISIGYDNSLRLLYPKDAGRVTESRWRIMQVDHVLVTLPTNYDFEGYLKSIPLPVRIPRGEEAVTDLFSREWIRVEFASSDEQNFKKLLRDKSGSVVTSSIMAESMMEKFGKNKIKIHAIPIASISYFLAFSKKSKISEKKMQDIWQSLEKLREDYIFVLNLYSRY